MAKIFWLSGIGALLPEYSTMKKMFDNSEACEKSNCEKFMIKCRHCGCKELSIDNIIKGN